MVINCSCKMVLLLTMPWVVEKLFMKILSDGGLDAEVLWSGVTGHRTWQHVPFSMRFLKDKVFRGQPLTVSQIKKYISEEFATKTLVICKNVCRSVPVRLRERVGSECIWHHPKSAWNSILQLFLVLALYRQILRKTLTSLWWMTAQRALKTSAIDFNIEHHFTKDTL